MKALILVGGYGTRLRPLTLSVPKPLVDFCNKAMILHQIEALAAVGVDEVVLAVNYQPEKMRVFLEEKEKQLGIKITTSKEDEPLDTAGPIKLAEKFLNDGQPFFVLNSDVSCTYPFEDMIAYQKKTNAAGVLLATPVEDPSKFGVILYDESGKIESFIEKPQQFISRFINAGIYLLTPEVFNRIELNKPTSIEKEVFPPMASDGLLYVMELKGFWADVGQPKDYLSGQGMRLAALAQDEPQELSNADFVTGNVLIHPSAKIGSGCKIGPDVVIGPNCVVGDGTRIMGSTLLPGAKVGNYSYINGSIIGWESKVGNWVRLDGLSVIGMDVKIKDEMHLDKSIVLPHKSIKKCLPAGTIQIEAMAFYQRIHRFGYYLTWTPVAILFSETVATLHWSSSSHTHMAPHIPPKSLCLVRPSWINRHAYLGHGHVVLVKSPNRSCPPLLRRVIALGGDYVEPSSFKQYLIYQQQKETQTQTQAETDITFVPPGFVWLEPDHCTNAHNNNNNSNSNDYECNGLVPISLIIGRVTHILPSGRSIPTIPSKRAFPSANHQMYPATATATATINR